MTTETIEHKGLKMTAKLLDGKTLANNLKHKFKDFIYNHGLTDKITLAVILIGDDPASKVYVKNKQLACEFVGIKVNNYHLDENIRIHELLELLTKLNNDPHIHGILLQLPLPQKLVDQDPDINKIILEKISPDKDVDGFNPYNIGRLTQRISHIRPCTPKGIIKLLRHYEIESKSKNVTIVGASNIVGRPLALEMLIEGATITVCHRFTKNLKEECKRADILCTAVGKPGLIKADYIKPGAVVVDIGITRLDNGKLAGDVDFNKAKNIASYITPVPGGVGPMTIAMLLENTIECYNLLTKS